MTPTPTSIPTLTTSGNREKYQAGGFDVKKAASNPQFGPGGKNPVKNPFDNKFSDPAHSDLTRKISWIGGRDYQIDGAGAYSPSHTLTPLALPLHSLALPCTPLHPLDGAGASLYRVLIRAWRRTSHVLLPSPHPPPPPHPYPIHTLTDEDAKKWVVIAKRKNANTLIADFSSKGGPEGVVVTAKTNGKG